jgi:hypothetical protein
MKVFDGFLKHEEEEEIEGTIENYYNREIE